jgi:O-antigen ligase
METIHLLYLAAAVLCSVTLALYSEHRLFMFVVLLWFLGYPILIQPEFIPELPILGIGIQPDRFILIMLVLVAFLRLSNFGTEPQYTQAADPATRRIFGFEKFLYLYGVVTAVTVGMLTQGVGAERLINIVSFQLLFVLVYFLARNLTGPNDYTSICMAIWILSIASGLVSIVQFFVDPDFLRVGVTRFAFGEYYRANGVFRAEYDHGFFQIVALLMTIYVRPRPNWAKLVWVTAPISVLLTMHRASWIALVFVLGTALLLAFGWKRTSFWGVVVIPFVLVVLIQFLPLRIWLDGAVNPEFLETRLLQDTLSVRLDQYSFALDMAIWHPFGVGSYEGQIYQEEVWRNGLPLLEGRAIIVHNGYLGSIVRHGIVGGIAFVAFLLGATLQLGRRVLQDKVFLLPFLVVCTYLLYNLFNDFSNLGNQIGIFLVLVLGTSITQSFRASGGVDQQAEVPSLPVISDIELAGSR